MEAEPPQPAPLDPNESLQELFSAHGLPAQRKGDFVIVDDFEMVISGVAVVGRQDAQATLVRLDIIVTDITLEKGDLTESFVGVGKDCRTALGDALHHFTQGMFHVLVSALRGRPSPEVVNDAWRICGVERQVTLGSLCTRGPFPESAWPGALEALKSQLSDMPLPPGTHGMSYFAYRSPGQPAVVDVSSNGISYGSLDVPLLAQAWPEAGSYYSARMFCIIAGAPGA